MQRFLSAVLVLMVLLTPIVASCGPQQPDLAQLTRMRTETADARAQESVGCISRDWVCAEIVALRGETCAELANETNRFTPQRQAELRSCALKDARRLPGQLPSADSAALPNDAPTIRQEAALAIFDGWRGALGANDPGVDPAGLDGAANDLRAIPGGEPYAATLQAARLIKQARAAQGDGACDILAQELAVLPSAPPPMLQPRVAIERDTAIELLKKRGCSL
jgi:hypothetical protein